MVSNIILIVGTLGMISAFLYYWFNQQAKYVILKTIVCGGVSIICFVTGLMTDFELPVKTTNSNSLIEDYAVLNNNITIQEFVTNFNQMETRMNAEVVSYQLELDKFTVEKGTNEYIYTYTFNDHTSFNFTTTEDNYLTSISIWGLDVETETDKLENIVLRGYAISALRPDKPANYGGFILTSLAESAEGTVNDGFIEYISSTTSGSKSNLFIYIK